MYTTRVKNMGELVRYYKRVGVNIKQAIFKGVLSGAMRCIPILAKSADDAKPASPGGFVGARDTGRYRGGFRAQRHPLGAMVFNARSYAGVIERGRRVGAWVPYKALIPWVRHRMGITNRKEAARVAWFLAKKIQRRGLRPRFVMGSVVKQMRAAVNDEIMEQILLAVQGKAP